MNLRREEAGNARHIITVSPRARTLVEVVNGFDIVGYGNDAACEEQQENDDAQAAHDIECDELP